MFENFTWRNIVLFVVTSCLMAGRVILAVERLLYAGTVKRARQRHSRWKSNAPRSSAQDTIPWQSWSMSTPARKSATATITLASIRAF